MDNLGAHRPKRIRELIEVREAELVFLPSYSPDLNPIIEEAFSKIKNIATARPTGCATRSPGPWRWWPARRETPGSSGGRTAALPTGTIPRTPYESRRRTIMYLHRVEGNEPPLLGVLVGS
jgi:hypothetical protein